MASNIPQQHSLIPTSGFSKLASSSYSGFITLGDEDEEEEVLEDDDAVLWSTYRYPF